MHKLVGITMAAFIVPFSVEAVKVLSNGGLYANCGSVALPKDGTPHSYMLYENGTLTWKNLETNEIFDTFTL